jgi:polygalacturonase
MKRQYLYIVTIVLLGATVVLLIGSLSRDTVEEHGIIRVEAFGADGNDQQDDSSAIQAAIDYSYENDNLPVQLLGKTYLLKQGLQLKEGVTLEMGVATKLLVEGNFNVLELEQKTSIKNGTIEITTSGFRAAAIYVSGKEQVWTTDRIHIENVTLYNSSGTNRGEGISFNAGTSGEFISFVNVSGVNVSGFHSAVLLQAAPPKGGEDYNFINGNRFVNMTLDDCIVCIQINSTATIPNEVSGNMFENLQIQLTERTDKAVILSGSNNIIEGMVWDASFIKDGQTLIKLTEESSENLLKINLSKDRVTDEGQGNHISTLKE